MNLKREVVVWREVSVGLVCRRRVRAKLELQMAGVVYFIRSLPSEK